MDPTAIATLLLHALGRAADPPRFRPVVDGIREALAATGLEVDRVQIPMSRMRGFRHPTLALVLLTWSAERGHDETEAIPHSALDALPTNAVAGTPFEAVLIHGASHFRQNLDEGDGGYPVLRQLRERGYRDYCAVGVPMPQGGLQPMSVASRTPFPDDVAQRLERLGPLFGLALYGVYRTSQAVRVSEVYIGREAGRRVLDGEIKRGSTRRLEAGIVFCDMRGFTALSERLGPEGVVAVVNELFEVVGAEAQARGGEILKFIGDAMLLVFPVEGDDRAAVARAIVAFARAGVARVAELAARRGLPLAVGFGGHIGEVVQGNVGTPERLDFTVMGPAVNLASRLEGMCKSLGAEGVFTEAVAAHVEGLVPVGAHAVRGVAEPVALWTLTAGADEGLPGRVRSE